MAVIRSFCLALGITVCTLMGCSDGPEVKVTDATVTLAAGDFTTTQVSVNPDSDLVSCDFIDLSYDDVALSATVRQWDKNGGKCTAEVYIAVHGDAAAGIYVIDVEMSYTVRVKEIDPWTGEEEWQYNEHISTAEIEITVITS